jgi:8-oxo-dGTP diphosphatase
MADQTITRIATLALLKEGRVLLLQRSDDAAWMPGVWHVPGGRVEAGETAHGAAIREICEELGVEVEQDDLQFGGIVAYDQTSSEDVDTFQFVAYKWSGEPSIVKPHKHQDMKWFPMRDLPESITQHTQELLNGKHPVYVHVVDGGVRTVIN